MIRQLLENLSKCRERVMDENLDLKTRERWTQLYNNTSTVLNQILKDRQLKDWEKRLQEIEEYEKEEGHLPGNQKPSLDSPGSQDAEAEPSN